MILRQHIHRSNEMSEDIEIKAGGFTLRGWHLLAITSAIGGLSSSIYYGYDVVNRFWDVEATVTEVVAVEPRIQALEQTLQSNDVEGLAASLARITTQMTQILETQATLVDLKSQVEKSTILTDGIEQNLKDLQADIDSTWDAIDALEKPL
jgi:hypothetical protein